jgi:hypothetical protein
MSDAAIEHSEPGSGPTPILPGQTFVSGVPPFQTTISGGDVDNAVATGSRRAIYPEDWLENPSEYGPNTSPPIPGA